MTSNTKNTCKVYTDDDDELDCWVQEVGKKVFYFTSYLSLTELWLRVSAGAG